MKINFLQLCILVGILVGRTVAFAAPSTPSLPVAAQPIHPAAPEPPMMTIKDFSQKLAGPTRVSLHLKNATLREALEALSHQSKVTITPLQDDVWQGELPRVTTDIDNADFWTAVRAITPAETQILWSPNWENHALEFFLGSISSEADRPNPVPMQQSGMFSIGVYSYERLSHHNLQWYFQGKPVVEGEETARLQVSILADPKLLNATSGFWPDSGSYHFEEITDDTGQNLPLNYNYFWPGFQADLFPRFRIDALFKPPAPNARQLKTVRGHFWFNVITRNQLWEIPIRNSAAHAERDFEIEGDARNQGDSKPVHLTIEMQPMSAGDRSSFIIELKSNKALPYSVDQLPLNLIRLQDAQGKAVHGQRAGGDLTQWAGSYSILERPETGAPIRLLVSVPTQIRRVEVPFEFHDLPLPPN